MATKARTAPAPNTLRIRLQLADKGRDLALFNLAIDS